MADIAGIGDRLAADVENDVTGPQALLGGWSGRIKTGIMVGLGEQPDEVFSTLADIRGAGVEILTIGQYLQPTSKHLPVARWVHPDEFAAFRAHALGLGFTHCEAGPLVRSSYHAHEHVRPTALEGAGRPADGIAPPVAS